MAGEHEPHSLQRILQNAGGSILVVAVLGTWNAAASMNEQLTRMSETMGGLRRDVERHESILMRLGGYSSREASAQPGRENGRVY